MEYSSLQQKWITKAKPMASSYQASRPLSSSSFQYASNTKHNPSASHETHMQANIGNGSYYHVGMQSCDESIDAKATSYILGVQERFRLQVN